MRKFTELLFLSLVYGTKYVWTTAGNFFMQEKLLRIRRGNGSVAPYAQTTSTCYHVTERMWIELNHHNITYPVKRILISMNYQQLIDMTCPNDQILCFCSLVSSMQDWDG